MVGSPLYNHKHNYFLDFPDETFIFKKRPHWITILPFFLYLFMFLVSLSTVISWYFIAYHFVPNLLISLFLIMISIATAFMIKVILDWYFHIYVLTNKKILEVQYSPFFSHVVNTIILDQVRCTEIDRKNNGFLHTLLDIGDLILVFDELTRQEKFIFKDISQPREIAVLLHTFFSQKTSITPNGLFQRKEVKY